MRALPSDPRRILLVPFPDEPTSLALSAAAERLGIRLHVVSPWEDADDVEGAALLPRVGLRNLDSGLVFLEKSARAGARLVNPPGRVRAAKDKWSLGGLSGVLRPRTAEVGPGAAAGELPPLPVVVKARRGARGEAVVLARTPEELSAALGRFGEAIVEELVPPEGRREWRVVVAFGEAIASCRRWPAEGDFRANRACGGGSSDEPAPPQAIAAALRATAAAGLGVAGIDVVLCPRGALVLDVNDSPGLVGISETLGVDVAERLVRAFSAWVVSRGEPRIAPPC